MDKLNINMLNMKKKKKDDYYIFKIDNSSEFQDDELDTKELNEHKILINSDENVIVQFKLNYELIKKIIIKYKDDKKEYDNKKYNYILINFETNKDTILEIIVFPLDLVTRINIWDVKIIEKKEQQMIRWDKIYIINLKRRVDRKILMIEKLSEEKIDNYEFIEAYDGKDEEIIDDYNLLKKYTKITNAGHFGCLLSHIKAIKKAKKNNYNNVMILEDDIIFNNNFLEEISKIKLPKYDILYLGGLINEKKLFFNGWGSVSKVMGAYGYIINKDYYDIILKKLEEFKDCVDVVYYKQKDMNNIYILNDIIKTNLDSSDTSKKKKKLTDMINIINEK
jgi:GR25 family glycosyltransferase involved in LPS biosynthesis